MLAMCTGSSSVRYWQSLCSPTSIIQKLSDPPAWEAGGTSGDRDLASISHWVPQVMPPGLCVSSLSNAPRHTANKGQTVNGDKALSQSLQAGLKRPSISIENPRANKGGCCLLLPFLMHSCSIQLMVFTGSYLEEHHGNSCKR